MSSAVRVAAWVYVAGSAVVTTFQLALAAGVPFGEYALGGAYQGRFPPVLRVAAVVQACVIAAMAAVVLSRAGIALPRWARAARYWIWPVAGISAGSLVLNLLSPSGAERALWVPVAALLTTSSLAVAIGRR